MKIIDLDQRSSAWLAWRKTVITATDCPAILGSSPWKTPYQCWQKKLGFLGEDKINPAMQRGIDLEPEARDLFIKNLGINMNPCVVESSEFEFLGASLDGLSDCKTMVLEVKCNGDAAHAQAQKGEIPQYYIDQMQHQLLVTRAKKAYYYSFHAGEGVCIEVLPDPEFEAKFIPKAQEFWRKLIFNEAPDLLEADYRDMWQDDSWKTYVEEYQAACERIKEDTKIKDKYRDLLIMKCEDQSSMGHGAKVIKIHAKGRIAYEEIPEIKDLDLEQYRKKPTTSWRIITS